MKKELAWVCAIMPKAVNDRIVSICKELNIGIGLPENVFRFPLHISLKKSFQTSGFELVKAEALDLLKQHVPLSCQVKGVSLHKNMIWLDIEAGESLMHFHQQLDHLLLTRYGIQIHSFDHNFQPHISLFTSGDRDAICEMYKLLQDEEEMKGNIEFRRFVIGSSQHRDEFFDL